VFSLRETIMIQKLFAGSKLPDLSRSCSHGNFAVGRTTAKEAKLPRENTTLRARHENLLQASQQPEKTPAYS
jgi:hypothetical protein